MPGAADSHARMQRYKSLGHHTVGFDKIEEAQEWIGTQTTMKYVGITWEWDGRDTPAMVHWFS